MSSRQSRASRLNCDAQDQNYFFFFAFFFFAFFAIGRAPLLKDRKLSRNQIAQKHTMRLEQSIPGGYIIHKRLGAGVLASGLQAISYVTEPN